MKGHKRGQITLRNMFSLLITLIVYFTIALPLLNPILAAAIADVQANPNQFSDMTVALYYALPFLLCLMIVFTGLEYAIPHVENRGLYG